MNTPDPVALAFLTGMVVGICTCPILLYVAAIMTVRAHSARRRYRYHEDVSASPKSPARSPG